MYLYTERKKKFKFDMKMSIKDWNSIILLMSETQRLFTHLFAKTTINYIKTGIRTDAIAQTH